MAPELVTMDDLSEVAREQLVDTLDHHSVSNDDPNLVWACLGCGSVATANNVGERDAWAKAYVDGKFDHPCCGTVVYFHTTLVQ